MHTITEQLEMIRAKDEAINLKLAYLAELKSRAYTASSMNYRQVNVQSSRSTDGIGKTVSRIDTLERELDRDIDHFVDHKAAVLKQLEPLDELSRQILVARYYRYLSFRRIAEELCINKDKVFRLHRRALERLENPSLAETA